MRARVPMRGTGSSEISPDRRGLYGTITAEEPMVCTTLRWRRQSGANSSLKRRPGDRAVNPGGGDRRRKELTGIFERYKKGMTWSHSPESWPFLRRTRPSSFWSRVQKLGQNSYSELPNHKLFQWFMRQFPTYRKRVFISAKWGVGR